MMLYHSNMAAKPVQISIDEELLSRIDADPETRTHGRSAFVRTAIERYLAAKRRREIDEQLLRAYGSHADAAMRDIADFIEAQVWPED
jgi:metal-responsive CopG/Arc/MetJ family transcriptional regulator